MASETKVTLIHFKDWKKWFWQLQGNVSNEIWPFIDPDSEELGLVEAPKRVEIADFDWNPGS